MFHHHVKINLKLKKTRNGGFEAFNYALHIGYKLFISPGGFQLFDCEFGIWVLHVMRKKIKICSTI